MISEIKYFFIRTLIVISLLTFFVALLLPNFQIIHDYLNNERAKMIVYGMVQNPAALFKLSEIDEKAGYLENARLEMELSINLLELHDGNREMLELYKARLDKLQDIGSGTK